MTVTQTLIRSYQKYISAHTKPHCRYSPTCSNYMIQSIDKHGRKGIIMGIGRICRCHPFLEAGYDPVPDHFTIRRHPNYRLSEDAINDKKL